MALPKLKFTPDAIFSLAANHGEKLLVFIALLCSLPLAWGGINALRGKMLSADKTPAEITQRVARAKSLLDRPADADERRSLEKILRGPAITATTTAEWRPPSLEPPAMELGLNRPPLGDLKKRSTPKIFPLEQLNTVAGLAAIAKNDQLQPNGMDPPPPDPTGMGMPQAVVMSPPATLMPYVIISGLVPYKKQIDEYISRYAATSFKDDARDTPLWRDYTIERQTVDGDRESDWETLDLTRAAEIWTKTWSAAAQDPVPEQFKLTEQENFRPQDVPLGFYAPLPALAERPSIRGIAMPTTSQLSPRWGLSAIHPWAVQKMTEILAEQQQDNPLVPGGMGGPFGQLQNGPPGTPSDPTQTGPFSDSSLSAQSNDPTMLPEDPTLMDLGPDGMLNPYEYRLFRFVDVTVKPGKAYRYRVTINLWNPNYNVAAKFLEEPAQAKEPFLAAAVSETSPAAKAASIRVPAREQVLVRMISKDDQKKGGLGSAAEILVLDEHIGTDKKPGSGNFELHATAANLGQLVGSKKESRRVEVGLTAQGRPRKEKFPTHDVLTDQAFLGLVGEQELEEKKRISRGFTPPPPFEMLFADTDGTLEHVTAVTSAEQVEAYLPTLPGYTPPQPPNPDMLGPDGIPLFQ